MLISPLICIYTNSCNRDEMHCNKTVILSINYTAFKNTISLRLITISSFAKQVLLQVYFIQHETGKTKAVKALPYEISELLEMVVKVSSILI